MDRSTSRIHGIDYDDLAITREEHLANQLGSDTPQKPSSAHSAESSEEPGYHDDWLANDLDKYWAQRSVPCKGSLELFISTKGEKNDDRLEREDRAKRVCSGCDATRECFAERIYKTGAGDFVVFGGTSDDDRSLIVRSAKNALDLKPNTSRLRVPLSDMLVEYDEFRQSQSN